MREAGLVMVRYADDAVVLCRSREEAEIALARMQAWVSANGLTLHPDKTHVGDCRLEGQGFEFLGYRFEAGRRLVRKKSLMALRDKVRALTPRNRGGSIDSVIASLNPTLKGWYAYFKQAHRYTFSSVDGFVRRRLRAIAIVDGPRTGVVGWGTVKWIAGRDGSFARGGEREQRRKRQHKDSDVHAVGGGEGFPGDAG